MLRRGKLGIFLLGILVLMGSWGFLGHKTAQQMAIYELPGNLQQFFFRNMDNLVANAPRPDIRRNEDSTEATKHFIDLEMFGEDAINQMPRNWAAAVTLFSKDSLLKYGYLPYHVVYMKERLTQAFRDQNKDSILFYAADMGHYIEDANVPLHTTVNYDGQLTNQKGLHSLWESMIPELEIADYTLSSRHKAQYLTHPEEAIWDAIRRSAILVPDMLQKEKEVTRDFTEEQKYRIQQRRGKEYKSYTTEFARAYAKSLGNSINNQLIHAADLVADFWYTSWVDAGKPNLKALRGEWHRAERKKLHKEKKAFRNNKLLKYNMLLSKMPESRTTD